MAVYKICNIVSCGYASYDWVDSVFDINVEIYNIDKAVIKNGEK